MIAFPVPIFTFHVRNWRAMIGAVVLFMAFAALHAAAVHDPVRDAYDKGQVSAETYVTHGIVGGAAVTAVSLATARLGGSLVAGAASMGERVGSAALVGAATGVIADASTQAIHISAGLQESYDVERTQIAALSGEVLGGGSAALTEAALAGRIAQTNINAETENLAQRTESTVTHTEPVFAAQNPTPVTEEVQSVPKIDANTPVLIMEGPKIEVTGQWMPETRSVRAEVSAEATNGNSNFNLSTTPSPALPDSPYSPSNVASRVNPPYQTNPAHDTSSPLYNPAKTPEPADAQTAYASGAVRGGMGTWYAQGQGGYYRYFSDNAGTVHFSGTVPASQVPNSVLKILGK